MYFRIVVEQNIYAIYCR